MDVGQHVAVEADGHHRHPSVEGDRRRDADREAVDGTTDELRRLGVHTGRPEQGGEGDPAPSSVADEVTAHVVGDARQRDRFVDEPERQQLVV